MPTRRSRRARARVAREQVGAVVVPRPGTRPTQEALAAFAGETLAYFQVPERWWLREETLPTNAAGKVLKLRLQSEWVSRPA